jgi:hypothetical protein
MTACIYTQTVEASCARSRNRPTELYLNSICLFSVLFNGEWRKTPFFLRNLWRAVAD